MITAFRGWNDGGQAATRRGRATSCSSGTRRGSPTIDPEGFMDFQAVRPTVTLDEGLTRQIEWPENAFYHAAIPGADRDAVILLGVEPNYRWRAFTDLVTGLARDLGVELVVTLGALLADVPHTRPAPVTGAATDPRARRGARSAALPLRGADRDRRRPPRRLPPGRDPLGEPLVGRAALRVARAEPARREGALRAALRPARRADRHGRARRGRGRVRGAGERGGRVGPGHAGVRRGARAAGRHDRVVRRGRRAARPASRSRPS